MTPVAAYYLFLADEQQRAAEKAFRQPRPSRPPRPSLIDRLRAAAAAVRQQPSRQRAG